MAGFVYILFSSSLKKTYTGSTTDVGSRLIDHNNGRSKFTSRGIPWVLWHQIEYPTIKEARLMEKYYKTGSGRRKLQEILAKILKP